MQKLKNQLSPEEAKELKKCESIIAVGFRSFIETATALLKISDQRLYRENYSTFEQYCKEHLKISSSRAYQLCDAGGVIKNLHNCGELTPEKEAQLRPMAFVEPEKQAEVWKEAVKSAGGKQPTTKQVEKAIDKVVPPKPEPVSDELVSKMRDMAAQKDLKAIKTAIQRHADTWIDADSLNRMVYEIRELLTKLEPAQASNIHPLKEASC